MSKDAAIKFLEKMEKDLDFKKRLQDATTDEERREIQEEENFIFSREEFMEAYKEKYHKTLSEEELKNIAAAGPSSANPLQVSVLYLGE